MEALPEPRRSAIARRIARAALIVADDAFIHERPSVRALHAEAARMAFDGSQGEFAEEHTYAEVLPFAVAHDEAMKHLGREVAKLDAIRHRADTAAAKVVAPAARSAFLQALATAALVPSMSCEFTTPAPSMPSPISAAGPGVGVCPECAAVMADDPLAYPEHAPACGRRVR